MHPVGVSHHASCTTYISVSLTLQVGLPLVAAQQKMNDDGYDGSLLSRQLTDMVPVDVTSTLQKKVILKCCHMTYSVIFCFLDLVEFVLLLYIVACDCYYIAEILI